MASGCCRQACWHNQTISAKGRMTFSQPIKCFVIDVRSGSFKVGVGRAAASRW